MEDHKVVIKADSIERFKKVQDQLDKLPKRVYNQIDTAHWSELMGCIECTFLFLIGGAETIFVLPRNVSKIQHFGTFIGIYSTNFFFRIEESTFQKLKDIKISYYFLDEEDISKTRDNKN